MNKEEILTKALKDIIEECPKPKLPYGKKVVSIATNTLAKIKAVDVDALVIRNATETKRQMLRELGLLIRKMGRREGKKHGNYWYLEIGNGYYFGHDDYNNAVNFNKGGERIKYYGIDWGGFETKLETEDFENALQLLKSFAKLSGVSV